MHEGSPVSVIIPTYKRYTLLLSCLRSLCTARMARVTPFEVIVVDDGGGLSRQIEREIEGLKIRWIYLPQNQGQPAAQAAGAAVAQGKFLAFLDDDAEVAPDWVDSIPVYFQRYPTVGAVLGRIEPFDRGHILARMRQQIYDRRHRTYTNPDYIRRLRDEHGLPPTADSGLSNHISGGNFAIRREALEAVGGIDPAIRLGSDDWLSLRLLKHCIPIGYNPAMVIRHHHNCSYRTLFRHNLAEGKDRIRIQRRSGKKRARLIWNAISSLIQAPFRIREFPEMLRADRNPVSVYFVYTAVQFFDAIGQVYEAFQQ